MEAWRVGVNQWKWWRLLVKQQQTSLKITQKAQKDLSQPIILVPENDSG
jgi:hypothetical protein